MPLARPGANEPPTCHGGLENLDAERAGPGKGGGQGRVLVQRGDVVVKAHLHAQELLEVLERAL